MPKCIQYRDLPGGPIEIQFSDDLSHWTLCGPCGMLSAEMYKDPNGHVFCKECLHACSDRKRIFCKLENRDIQLSELFEAHDVVRITQSLTVFCPNKKNGCSKHCDLSNIKEHYVECPMTPNIKCKACQANLLIKDFTDHERLCPEVLVQCQECVTGIPRRALKDHQKECGREQRPSKQLSTIRKSEPQNIGSSKGSVSPPCMGAEAASNEQGPPSLGSNSEEEKIVCEFCQKTVKFILYQKHMAFCMKECPYCEVIIPNKYQTEHQKTCERNPDNVSARESPRTTLWNTTFADVVASSPGEKASAVYESDWEALDVGAKDQWPTGVEAKGRKMEPTSAGSSSPSMGNQRPPGASARGSFGRGRGTQPPGGFSSAGWENHNSRASPECSDRRGKKLIPGGSSSVGSERTDSSRDLYNYESGTHCAPAPVQNCSPCQLPRSQMHQPTLVRILVNRVVICLQILQPAYHVGAMAPIYERARPLGLMSWRLYHPRNRLLESQQTARNPAYLSTSKPCLLPPQFEAGPLVYYDNSICPEGSGFRWRHPAVASIWPASPVSIFRFLAGLLNSIPSKPPHGSAFSQPPS